MHVVRQQDINVHKLCNYYNENIVRYMAPKASTKTKVVEKKMFPFLSTIRLKTTINVVHCCIQINQC